MEELKTEELKKEIEELKKSLEELKERYEDHILMSHTDSF